MFTESLQKFLWKVFKKKSENIFKNLWKGNDNVMLQHKQNFFWEAKLWTILLLFDKKNEEQKYVARFERQIQVQEM